VSFQDVNQNIFIPLNECRAILFSVGKLLIAIPLDPLLQSGEHSHMLCFESDFVFLHLLEDFLVVNISFLYLQLLGNMNVLSGLVVHLADK